MTPQALIDSCATRLREAGVALGQGTLYPEDEAAWLVLWSLGWPLDTDTSELNEPLSSQAMDRVWSLLNTRIQTRQPLAYLTQEAWLQGVPFHVDARCLIPRSLIAEVLIQGVLDAWLHPHAMKALDLCTGGGSLAVLLAMTYPDAQVDALDLSEDALAVARINIERHGLSDRIHPRLSDGLQAAQGPYDLILCNPPYVNAQSMSALPEEFLHEPSLALHGGPDGMDFIRQLIPEVASHLSPQGILVLEIGHEIEHFQRAFPWLSPLFLPTALGDDQVLLFMAQDLRA